ncbi:MAG: aldehyde dehydrogenase family protein [Terriglobales bacterium]
MSQSTVVRETAAQAATYPFLLDGKFLAEGERVEIRAPWDQGLVGVTYRATREHAQAATQAAVRAFEITRKLPAYERQRVLRAISAALAREKENLARVLAQEAGKPIKLARGEIDRAVFTFSAAAEETTRIYGEMLPLDVTEQTAGRWGITRRFPLGPVLAITPFNFPINLVAHKIAPAIAAGCTMVFKPAPQAPLSGLMLAELVQQVGWPDGALNAMLLSNETASELVQDERFKMLTFTGSAAVGWQLKNRAGRKKVVLELGGNAGVIVHSDADLAYAAERCVVGGFAYAGQVCISVQRIFVQRAVAEEFTDFLVEGACKLKAGDPLDQSTTLGPMITEKDAIRAEQWVREAVDAGAILLCGGKRQGSVLEPTVLTATRPEMRVNCQEVFAPVVTVEPYDDFGDAIRRMNDTPYGLQAGVFTRDTALLFRAFEELEVGAVIASDVPSFRVDTMPYGGVKQSGLGREGLRWSIKDMTEERLLVMNTR